MAARIAGILAVGSDVRCLVLQGSVLVWPEGYSAVAESDGTVVVANGDGREVARTGQILAVTGGQTPTVTAPRCSETSSFAINEDLPPVN